MKQADADRVFAELMEEENRILAAGKRKQNAKAEKERRKKAAAEEEKQKKQRDEEEKKKSGRDAHEVCRMRMCISYHRI